MGSSTSSASLASRLVIQHIRILPGTRKKLSEVARQLGIRYNPTGRILDLCVDLIQAQAGSQRPGKRRGYGSVPVAVVRLIRVSKEKTAVLALEHRIAESMVSAIRQRKRYAWVR